MAARYYVGIDLGTTNSALAYIDAKAKSKPPTILPFPIPQLVAPGETAVRQLLPSFLYRPGPHELPPGATALPWNKNGGDAVGEFAREQGAKVPGRLVSSAKSWLCHSGADRTAALLPWGAPPDVTRISPLEASAAYLRHIVDAWNFAHGKSPDDHLGKLGVVLTVPASFDDVARTLTVEAAKVAGLTDVMLLEEPQAAFYCWQHLAPRAEQLLLKAGMTCLVIDIGGGTTDFSLIAAVEEQGELRFVRRAVGDHLLLGGDNMDLALARFVEAKIPAARLDAVQFSALVQACRRAKELLLGSDPPDSVPVTVVGRGRSVIGGTVSMSLNREDVQQVVTEGFFPIVHRHDGPRKSPRAGLHEMGLPYVDDPAVTRHLAQFLSRHMGEHVAPDAVLFNGGVFQPAQLRQRLLESIAAWYVGRQPPIILTTPSLDLAVSHGAASYAWLRHTGGRAIGGGTARAYYVEVSHGASQPGVTAVCVVPRHMEENQEVSLNQPELDLALGEPVSFPLFASTARDDQAGALITVAPEQLRGLPPLTTVLRGGKKAGGASRTVPVTLAARTTAIGTLELYCVAKDKSQRWRLEFTTRDAVRDDADEPDSTDQMSQASEVLPEATVQTAQELIRASYASDSPTANELNKALESVIERRRDEWPTAICRRLWDAVADVVDQRRRSPAHLSRWYNMAGFCLRPGFGDLLDRFRVDSLWKLLHAPKPGGAAPPEPVGADAWIMWRRVAGGLTAAFQKTLFDRLRTPLLAKGKAALKPGANELAEMWRAAASLERLDVKLKLQLGSALLGQIRTPPSPTYAFWSIARLGARDLLHGPLNGVLHPEVIAEWLDPILGFRPTNDSDRMGWAFCLAQLTRRTGLRALDIDESLRPRVLSAMRAAGAPPAWVRMVEEVTLRSSAERSAVFGDTLPIGLRLKG